MARSGIRFRWARGWSRACCWCLRTSRHAVPRHGHQRRCVDGNVNRRSRFFGQMDCSTWPTHRFGVLLGSRGNFRGRPARVRRPAVGSPKKLARGNWHASIRGRAVTGARTKRDVGGCSWTSGARKRGLRSATGGKIFFDFVFWVKTNDHLFARAVGRYQEDATTEAQGHREEMMGKERESLLRDPEMRLRGGGVVGMG